MGFAALNAAVRVNVRYVPVTFGVTRSRLSEIVEENLRSSEYGLHQFEIGELTANSIANGQGSMRSTSLYIGKIIAAKSKRKKLMYAALLLLLTVCRLTLRLVFCIPAV